MGHLAVYVECYGTLGHDRIRSDRTETPIII
jgi:hypothetical protein